MGGLESAEAENTSKFISCKEGEVASFVVKDIKRKMDNPKFDPKDRKGNPQGWHFEIYTTEDKALSVSSYALQGKLMEAGRKDRDNPKGALVGRKLTIKHPARGEYEVILGVMQSLPPTQLEEPENEGVPF